MKRKYVLSVILSVLVTTLTGCGDKVVNDSKVEVGQLSISKDFQDSLYESYIELFPKVEKVLKDNKIEYKIIKNKLGNAKYSEYESINVSRASEPGIFSDISYSLGTDKEGNITDIRIVMFLGIDSVQIKSKGFKVEDSMFSEISEVFLGKSVDYSDTNSKINELVNNNDFDKLVNDYDNIIEVFSVDSNFIGYSIIVNP